MAARIIATSKRLIPTQGDFEIEAEQVVSAFYHEHGLPITVVRPVSIYGPRSNWFVLQIVEV